MSRSFLRLVVSSVILSWMFGLVAMLAYASTLSWTDERVRREGVILVRTLLSDLPPESRADRLRTLSPNFAVPFSLMSDAEVERRVGRRLRPGERLSHVVSWREEWHFLAFRDGGVLAAGPVNPTVPRGFIPIGFVLGVFMAPLLAAVVAYRIQRQLGKVERASQALAEGELSARVDNDSGPSSELAASFNAMAERVERLVRGREELVQAVSHELGTPLSRLRFQVELIGPEADSARLDAMVRELDALDELVAELMQYVQSDTRDLDPTSFAPLEALRDLAELAQLDGPTAISVELDCPDTLTVHADRRLFLRAVENVLRNAATHAEAHVRLEVLDTPDAIHVCVHDDGPGIPEAIRDNVTLPFFRPQGARERASGGVGLGLAIVSRIMLAHGGRLQIEDSALGGAMVGLEWPSRA